METITVTRALNELKLLDKRITKKIDGACFGTSSINGTMTDRHCTSVADLQSIEDLISRRSAIKEAITVSNALTVVNINGDMMTMAAAIERKSSIDYHKELLASMRARYRSIQMSIDVENDKAQHRLDALLESSFGKDTKSRPSEMTELTETFWKANRCELVDPIGLADKIEKLDEFIDNFENEVDLTLSETNSRTEIAI